MRNKYFSKTKTFKIIHCQHICPKKEIFKIFIMKKENCIDYKAESK